MFSVSKWGIEPLRSYASEKQLDDMLLELYLLLCRGGGIRTLGDSDSIDLINA